MSNISLFGAEFCSLSAADNIYFSGYILKCSSDLAKNGKKTQKTWGMRLSSNRQGPEKFLSIS